MSRFKEAPMPRHPYRDSALVFGAMAAVIPLIAWLTGGNAARAAGVAFFFFLAATGWNWWRFRQRGRREAGAAEEAARSAVEVAAGSTNGKPSSENGSPGTRE